MLLLRSTLLLLFFLTLLLVLLLPFDAPAPQHAAAPLLPDAPPGASALRHFGCAAHSSPGGTAGRHLRRLLSSPLPTWTLLKTNFGNAVQDCLPGFWPMHALACQDVCDCGAFPSGPQSACPLSEAHLPFRPSGPQSACALSEAHLPFRRVVVPTARPCVPTAQP